MQKLNIFGNSATIELPDDYHPWRPAENRSNATPEKPNPTSSLLAAAASLCETVDFPNDTMFEGNGSHIIGVISKQEWDQNLLNKRLDECYRTIARSLPLVDNAQIATRKTSENTSDEKESDREDGKDETSGEPTIGMIRYTFATPQKDWFACTVLLPAKNHEATLTMICNTEALPGKAEEFMSIAESIDFPLNGSH
ncbi:hypothetical protein PT279_00335 [Bifidobacterium sp. ESL0784]|uniref:hypothetical protein n=1 Tax=Bifidobacterium sp. ESL0784 TaxID=2983231 RepID=UPI0023F98CDC|nr:hypothetical protein [Bifidobacterium sp. ESL0784]MDF7640053.1 hypothetical protein [Bifidobacterium sp. ESL0784]